MSSIEGWEDGAHADYPLGFRGGFFNRALRLARLRLRLTQRELADRVGVSVSAICQLETLRGFPKPEQAALIARFLGVETHVLFPEWLREMRQTCAIQEVPLASIDELISRAPRALAAVTSSYVIDVEDTSIAAIAVDAVRAAIGGLSEKEQLVLRMRFGLDGDGTKTLGEVADVFGVTRERIRQIEAKALRKLRHPSRAKTLRPLIEYERGDDMVGPFACAWPRPYGRTGVIL